MASLSSSSLLLMAIFLTSCLVIPAGAVRLEGEDGEIEFPPLRLRTAIVTDLSSADPVSTAAVLTAADDARGLSLAPIAAALVMDQQQGQTVRSPLPTPGQGRARTNSLMSASGFSSDNSSSSSPSPCGFCRTDLRLGETGEVASPGFPGPYPDGQSCLWLLQTRDGSRIRLHCDAIHLQPCGPLGRGAPLWRDYLIISPLWSFKKSWVYCGHAVTVQALTHTSVCDKMAVSFRSDENGHDFSGFHCTYQAIQ